MAVPTQLRLNLGGEGEEPNVINQQPEWATSPHPWATLGPRLALLIAAGEPFLFCRNTTTCQLTSTRGWDQAYRVPKCIESCAPVVNGNTTGSSSTPSHEYVFLTSEVS